MKKCPRLSPLDKKHLDEAIDLLMRHGTCRRRRRDRGAGLSETKAAIVTALVTAGMIGTLACSMDYMEDRLYEESTVANMACGTDLGKSLLSGSAMLFGTASCAGMRAAAESSIHSILKYAGVAGVGSVGLLYKWLRAPPKDEKQAMAQENAVKLGKLLDDADAGICRPYTGKSYRIDSGAASKAYSKRFLQRLAKREGINYAKKTKKKLYEELRGHGV